MPIRCRLAEVRARHGRVSLAQLSRETGITTANLSRLDSGKTTRIDFETWEKLCRHFDLPPGDFFELAADGAPGQRDGGATYEVVAGQTWRTGDGRTRQVVDVDPGGDWVTYKTANGRAFTSQLEDFRGWAARESATFVGVPATPAGT